MAPCRRSTYVGIADRGGLCAPYAAGYDQHDGAGELRCRKCRRLFKKHEWLQRRDGGAFHVSVVEGGLSCVN